MTKRIKKEKSSGLVLLVPSCNKFVILSLDVAIT